MESHIDRQHDITVKDLSERYPGLEDEINRIDFDVENSERRHSSGDENKSGGDSVSRVMRDVIVGLVVGVILFYMTGYLPVLAGN